VPVDELQVKLTAKDDLSAKLKAARAEFTRLGKEAAAANRALRETGKGQGEYDRLRAQWIASRRELDRLAAAQTRVNREIRAATAAPVSGWARAGNALQRYHATLQKVGAASALVGALMGKKAVDATKTLVSQALATQRVLGGTVEEASRWNNAAALSGVTADQFASSVRFLGKNLESASKSEKRAGDLVAQLGFDFRDANGNVKPLGELLPQISDAFARMPAGAQKTALAVQLFGRSGLQMLPMLNRGSAALDKFRAKAAELGVVVGPDMVASFKQYSAAQKEYNQALLGFQVAVGSLLLPVVAGFMSALQGVAQWMTHLPGPIRGVVVALGALTTAFLVAAPTISRFMLAVSNAGGAAAATAGLRARLAGIGSFLMGPWGVALAAGAVALGVFAKAQQDTQRNAEDLAATLDKTTGAATLATAQQYASRFTTELPDDWKSLGGWITEATTALTQGGPAAQAFEDKLAAATDKLNAVMRTPELQEQQDALSRLLSAYRGMRGDSEKAFEINRAAAAAAAAANTAVADTALTASSACAAEMANSAAAKDAVDARKAAVKELDAAYKALTGTLDAQAAVDAEWTARQQLAAALDKQPRGQRTVVGMSETAVANRAAVTSAVQAAVTRATTGGASPATQLSRLTASYRALRTELSKRLPRAEVDKALGPMATLIGQVRGKAKDIGEADRALQRTQARAKALAELSASIRVDAPTAGQTIAKLSQVDKQARNIPTARNVLVSVTGEAQVDQVLARIRSALQALTSRVWTGIIQWRTSMGWAGGGPVVGPGTGTSDSVPAWLSAGEYVTRAAAVQRVGLPALAAINRADAWSGDRVRAVVAAATGRPGDVVVPTWAAPPAVPARAPSAPAPSGGEVHVHVHGPFAAELDVAAAARRAARAAVAEIDAERRRRGTR